MFTRSPVKKTASGCRALIVSAAGQFALRADERPDMRVGELRDTESVECRGNAIGADFDPVYMDARAPEGGAPEQVEREETGCQKPRAGELQKVEHIVEHPRENRYDPGPEEPHVEVHHSGAVVAADPADDGRDQRQGVGGQGPDDERPQGRGSPAALVAEVYPVGGKGCQGKNQGKCKEHSMCRIIIYLRPAEVYRALE